MARAMYASVLPSITCSDCGADIEISMMGDHVCTGEKEDAGPSDPPEAEAHHHDRKLSHAFPPPFASPISPADAPSLAERHFTANSAPQHEPAPSVQSVPTQRPSTAGKSSESPSAESYSPKSQEKLLRHTPQRSATDPIPTIVRPPSEDMRLPQDSAFPIFPSKRGLSRPGAPTSLGGEKLTQRLMTGDVAPLSPSLNGGAHVLKRMNTITPGPFGARSRKVVPEVSSPQPFALPRETPPPPPLAPAPMAASGPPPRPKRPETDDSLFEKLQGLPQSFLSTPTPPAPEVPPLIFTKFSDDKPRPVENTEAETSQSNSKTDQSSSESQPQDRNSASDSEPLQPLPDFSPLHSTTNRLTGHASTSSESSAGSRSGSTSRTESSRSSHSSPISPHESGDFHHKNQSLGQNSYTSETSRQSFVSRQLLEPHFKDSLVLASPALQGAFPEQEQASREDITASGTQALSRTDTNRAQPEAAKESPVTKLAEPESNVKAARIPKSKGTCRGCNQQIYGKSVKAADGRLTGRYHRECFVCHTCRNSFDTAEFYVHDNHPYCAHHYHIQNGSLCRSCNTGIEGKYVETQPSQKFHLGCFTCQDCRRPLTSEYYELGGRFYCKADAFKAYEKGRSLMPGNRFPERRMTRLMAM